MQNVTHWRRRMDGVRYYFSSVKAPRNEGVSWGWWNSSVSRWKWRLQESGRGVKDTYRHAHKWRNGKTSETWVRSGGYTNVNFLALITCTLYMAYSKLALQDVTIGGSQMKSSRDLSVLFLQLPVNLYLLQKKKFKKWHERVSACLEVACHLSLIVFEDLCCFFFYSQYFEVFPMTFL